MLIHSDRVCRLIYLRIKLSMFTVNHNILVKNGIPGENSSEMIFSFWVGDLGYDAETMDDKFSSGSKFRTIGFDLNHLRQTRCIQDY